MDSNSNNTPSNHQDYMTFNTDNNHDSEKNANKNKINNHPQNSATHISDNTKLENNKELSPESKNNLDTKITNKEPALEIIDKNTATFHESPNNNQKTLPINSNKSLNTVPHANHTIHQSKDNISDNNQENNLEQNIFDNTNDNVNNNTVAIPNKTSDNNPALENSTQQITNPLDDARVNISIPEQGTTQNDQIPLSSNAQKQNPNLLASNNNILHNITNHHVPSEHPASDTSVEISNFGASQISQIRSRHYSSKRSEGSEFQFPTPNTRSLAFSELDWSLREGDRSGFGGEDFGFSGTNLSSSPRGSSKTMTGLGEDMEDVKRILDQPSDPKQILKAFDNYLIRSKGLDLAKLKKSRHVKLKKYKESICLGEFFNGKRHGKGIMLYGPKRLYEGDWENDAKHGKGYEILPTGSHYEGDFLNGKPDGYGVFKWKNGEVYEGEWKNGLKHGKGIWRGIKGESYEGDWKNGKAEGRGVHIWRNGDRYEGELKSYLKHGEGLEKFANGDYYQGSYVNGKPEGYGEYNWATGYQYKGNFKNGLRHGKGNWQKVTGSGDKYEGEWSNDKKCGHGVYIWASGNRYQGNYFDDFRHGYGEMYWTDGNTYKGDWDKGIQNGQGQVLIPGKGVKKGTFKQNTLLDDVPYPVENELPISMSKPVPKGFSATSAQSIVDQEISSSNIPNKIHHQQIKKTAMKGFAFVDDELPTRMSRPVKIKGYGEIPQPPNKASRGQRFASQVRNPSQNNHHESFNSDRTTNESFLPEIRHRAPPPHKRPDAPSSRIETDSRDYSVDKVVNPVPKVNRNFIKPEAKQLLKYKQIIRQVSAVKN